MTPRNDTRLEFPRPIVPSRRRAARAAATPAAGPLESVRWGAGAAASLGALALIASAALGCAGRDPEPPLRRGPPPGAGMCGEGQDCPRAGAGPGDGMGGPMGRGARGGGRGMMGPGWQAPCSFGSGPLAPDVLRAAERALGDERRAEATYGAAVGQFGRVPPFVRIERSEGRHSAALERLLTTHGHAPPTATAPAPAPRFAGVADACRAGASGERATVALYDELLKADLPADARCVFEHLQRASRERHLPAFERCGSAPND